MYTLDTNAIIYYLKDEPIATPLLCEIFAQPAILYISAITEIELFGFPFLASEEQKQIEEVLQTIVIIPVDSRVARAAASLRREFRLKIPDSAVAATALLTGSTLLTRNQKDFRRVPHLQLQSI